MSLRPSLLLAACLLMAASSFALADSRRHKDYDRAAANSNSNSWPLWLTALAITFSVGALAVCGCALSIVGWMYAQYKMARESLSLAQFAWELLQKVLRGENPLPRDSRGHIQGLERIPGNRLTKYIAKHGVEKADELWHTYIEKDEQGNFRRRARTSSTSSTDSESSGRS